MSVLLHWYFQVTTRTGMRFRAAIVTAVYRKALLLSQSARQAKCVCFLHVLSQLHALCSSFFRTTGEIVNLMSVDAGKLQDLFQFLHMVRVFAIRIPAFVHSESACACQVWSGPFQISLSITLLWFQLGYATLAGLAIMICMTIPLNAFLGERRVVHCASSDPVLIRIAVIPARKVKAVQSELMKVKDHRIKVTNEALQNVKVGAVFAR